MRYRIEIMGNSMKTMQQLVSVVQSPVKNRQFGGGTKKAGTFAPAFS
jgi:hypothetical protein